MRVETSADILHALGEGQRLGLMRRSLHATTHQLFASLTEGILPALEAVRQEGLSESADLRRAAWDGLLDRTEPIIRGHEALGQLQSLERRAREMLDPVTRGAGHLTELAAADLPEAILPDDLREQLAALGSEGGDARRFGRSLVGLGLPSPRAGMAESLEWMHELRLQALNARCLSEIAAAPPDRDALSLADLEALGPESSERVRALRDAARRAARSLGGDVATPVFALALWGALLVFERWLLDDGIRGITAASAAAGARVAAEDADAERWARDAALLYDTARQGLALDAGVRAVLTAHAAQDAGALEDYAEAAGLTVGSAVPDLPRTAVQDVAAAPEGRRLEVAGMVTHADIRVGGPGNRSILRLGDTVNVLVPHVAVSSFGLERGLWLQVRGKAYPGGKDGIPGPAVMVDRIRRGEAAADSFTDHLIHSGRRLFELRPGDLDLVGGRLAGDRLTLNEIGMRR